MGYKCPSCGFEGERPAFKRVGYGLLVRCPKCSEGFDPSKETEEYARAESHLGFVYDDGFLTSWKLTPVEATV